MIKVLIADDNAILRNTLKLLIEQDQEIHVVGLSSNGLEAYDACESLGPDLILMDIQMPVCDGIEATKRIKAKYMCAKILMLTTFCDKEYVTEAIKNGADGYVLKDVKEGELIRIIKNVVGGFKVVQESVFENIKYQVSENAGTEKKKATVPDIHLTDRENDIIRLVVDGRSNKEIAYDLGIAEGTVRNILSSILVKVNLQDRTQLAVFAIKNNLV